MPAAALPAEPEDSLGTWLLQIANAPESKTYLAFHKDGKVTISAFTPDFGVENHKNVPITRLMVSEATWEQAKSEIQLGNGWTLPHPLGGKVKIPVGYGKADGVLTKVAKTVPVRETSQFKDGKSTKIPGKWECGHGTWEFHDDGVAIQTTSAYTPSTGYKSSATVSSRFKWRTENGQLIFGSAMEVFSFPYPLKGETSGKHAVSYGRGFPPHKEDATIKPVTDGN